MKGATEVMAAAWSSVLAALKGGLGVGILPSFMGDSENSHQHVLHDFETQMPIWLVYHPDLKNSARVRAFLDFAVELLKRDFKFNYN